MMHSSPIEAFFMNARLFLEARELPFPLFKTLRSFNS
jgi:hypothetical protein